MNRDNLIPPALLAAVLLSAGAAHAEAPKLSATVGVASDYVFRGVSQTDEGPFVFGTVDLAAGAFYAGVGAETVDFGNSIDAEYDIWAGWTPKVGEVQLNLGVVRYGYVNAPAGVDIDTVELKAGGSVPVGGGSVGAVVAWTDDFFGSGDRGTYFEVNGSSPPLQGWTIGGALGQQQIAVGGDYSTWNLGASHAFGPVTLDLRYHDTGAHDRGDIFGARAVATLKATF
jgi:uncharacterized protein (TIGR02001 family)